MGKIMLAIKKVFSRVVFLAKLGKQKRRQTGKKTGRIEKEKGKLSGRDEEIKMPGSFDRLPRVAN